MRRRSADTALRRPSAGRAKETLVHAEALYNLARYLTRDPSDAEDLVQETYERALRAWGQLERDANVKAWLFRVLRNAFTAAEQVVRDACAAGGRALAVAGDVAQEDEVAHTPRYLEAWHKPALRRAA